MTPLRAELEEAPRAELIRRARRAGVQRPDVMTRMELVDEILRLSTGDPVERKKARGFLGIARDLIASVVEQGLNMPDAAALIRGDVTFEPRRPLQGPVATVTLAEIYAAQGHLDRAMAIIDEVLSKEPDHEVAQALRERFRADAARKGAVRVPAPEPDTEPEVAPPPPPEPEAERPEAPAPAVAPSSIAVIFRSGPGQWTVAWQLGGAPREALHVRALEVIPSEDGAPMRREHGLDVEGVSGSVRLHDIDDSAIIRAAVGFRREDGFRAVIVATEVEWDASGSPVVRWSPRRAPPPSHALGQLAVQDG